MSPSCRVADGAHVAAVYLRMYTVLELLVHSEEEGLPE